MGYVNTGLMEGDIFVMVLEDLKREGWTGKASVQKQLWKAAEARLPGERGADYTQAIMDLGALVCTRSVPACDACPVSQDCRAFQLGQVDRFPWPKPPIKVSEKNVHLLILQDKQGRVLLETIPRALPDVDDYEWVEGEIVAGLALGWNFGDGHLNGMQLLEAIQEQCGFEEGELRVIMVESQPLFGSTMAWKIVDAASGVLEEGETRIADMREMQPWPTGATAEAYQTRAG